MNAQGEPPVDPFDLLAAMAQRDDRPLAPGDDHRADALLARIVAEPVVVPIGRRRRARVLVAAAIIATVGAGTAAAAIWSRQPADAVSLRCYSEASATPAVRVGLDVDPASNPTDQCASAWTDGRISTAGAPELVACVDELDSTVVVPGGPETCASLGWAPASGMTPEGRLDAEVVRAVADALYPCETDAAAAAAIVRDVLVDLGADAWTVEVHADGGTGCFAPAPDAAAHRIDLVRVGARPQP